MFTVRKISSGIGVERTWPVASPWIEKIEIKKKGRARRAKLYYLRKKIGKKAVKIKKKLKKPADEEKPGKTRGRASRKKVEKK